MGLHFQRVLVFTLTFVSYAIYHMSRKNLSGVKPNMSHDWLSNDTHEVGALLTRPNHLLQPFFETEGGAKKFLGILDALFMLCYSGGLVLWGGVGDRWNPLYVVVIGMLGSGLTLSLFGDLPFYTHFYNLFYYLFIYAVFGFFQGAGFPNEVAIMSNWFPKEGRGFVMGMWASCQPVGNILGGLLVAGVVHWGYEWTFTVNAAIIVVAGVVTFFTLKVRPEGSLAELANAQANDEDADEELVEHQAISFCKALTLPNVVPYCLCNACLKFVNYAFFFWLPLYLHNKFGWGESSSNQLATWYDLGGIVGSILGGIISVGPRFPVHCS